MTGDQHDLDPTILRVRYPVVWMPDPDRLLEAASIVGGFSEYVVIGDPERRRGVDLAQWGFEAADALHIACAEKARADVVLTTDDALVTKAARHAERLGVRVANPLKWLEEELTR